MECLRGIFPSCYGSFSDTLFQYFQPVIEDTVALLPIYESFAAVIVAILEMYVDVMEHILCFLNAVSLFCIYIYSLHLSSFFRWNPETVFVSMKYDQLST